MITFGAFAAAGMPILGAIIGVVTTLMGITAVASVVTIASASTTVALMLGLSCGIDYGLFILSRHRTNLLNGMTPEESVPLAMGTAGSSVVFAALTVIIALCGLTVVGIPFLTVMGLAAAASVAVALLIALTLVPGDAGLRGHEGRQVHPAAAARRARRADRPPFRRRPGQPGRRPAGPGSSCGAGCQCSSAGSPCSACSPSRRCPIHLGLPSGGLAVPPAPPSARPTTSPPKASAPASTARC